jgi:hypothetical protein
VAHRPPGLFLVPDYLCQGKERLFCRNLTHYDDAHAPSRNSDDPRHPLMSCLRVPIYVNGRFIEWPDAIKRRRRATCREIKLG